MPKLHQILTRKGTCVAKAKRKTVTKKRRRRSRPEVVEEEIIEPRVRRRRDDRNKMFDNELDHCPRCGSI